MLPIDAVLPELITQLAQHRRLVVQAPPGAGKTTRVPLVLLEHGLVNGKTLLIQPRRLAVYGAARRMAATLNEQPGQTIGYRTRYDQKIGPDTRIEVITEGIFLRRIQTDPELEGVDLVIFDEFHERSVTIDLALAFALESQSALREDLKLMLMSATLDGERLAQWLEAPLIRSEGRSFPVATHYAPVPVNRFLEQHVAAVIRHALAEETGNLLVFLPGFRELQRVKQQLDGGDLSDNTQIHYLHASLPQAQQEQAIAPTNADQRKVVLATNVAETSVTIEGIRVVIDSGLVRVARYDERSGMGRLHTETISAASAEQRRGRAGRVEPGVCYRLWSDGATLQRFNEPEMLHADLAPVALELCLWGASDPTDLPLLDTPPGDRYQRALNLLNQLDAVDRQYRITSEGQKMASLGMHPRLARLVISERDSDRASAALACSALLTEGDPLRFEGDSHQADIHLRLALWQSNQDHGELYRDHIHRGTWQRLKDVIQQTAKRTRLRWQPQQCDHPDIAIALARAFPDRVAQLRSGQSNRYLLANGKGMRLAREDALAGQPYLVVLETDGSGSEPRIRMACTITASQLTEALGEHIKTQEIMEWNEQRGAVEAETREQFNALILHRKRLPEPWPQSAQQCLLEALTKRELKDLPWNQASEQLIARLQWLHQQAPDHWPDVSLPNLIDQANHWLLPYLNGITTLSQVRSINLLDALKNTLDWSLWNELDRLAPSHWTLPTGNQRLLDYQAENGPVLRARLQEFYGLNQHPNLPSGQPLLLELLSPAQRPIQLTRDLPGFWQGSYAEVAKDMRGRYPKHYWPEDPSSAQATTKTKRHLDSE